MFECSYRVEKCYIRTSPLPFTCGYEKLGNLRRKKIMVDRIWGSVCDVVVFLVEMCGIPSRLSTGTKLKSYSAWEWFSSAVFCCTPTRAWVPGGRQSKNVSNFVIDHVHSIRIDVQQLCTSNICLRTHGWTQAQYSLHLLSPLYIILKKYSDFLC